MKPIKLTPALKDYLWGGTRLKTDFGIESDLSVVAEAWVFSCHPDGESRASGGDFEGMTLKEVIEQLGDECLGTNAAKFPFFPMLIKLIDAAKPLSIQVHPDDEYALANENQFGKTEMWYIVDCDEGASLYYGFREPISEEEFKKRIEDDTICDVLNRVPVHKGDCFFINSGTIHAIGEGILIAEIQQNSNCTYRVYDYGRVGADGKPRQLHVEQAVKVTKLEPPKDDYNFGGHLVRSPYFTVDQVDGGYAGNCDDESFTSVLVVDGSGTICCGDEKLEVTKGDSLFLPADSGKFALDGSVKALITRVGTI